MIFAAVLALLVLAACGQDANTIDEVIETPVPTPITTPIPAPLPMPTPEPMSEFDREWIPQTGLDIFYATTANAHLRAGPSKYATSHGVVPEDTWVELFEQYNNEWYRVAAFRAETADGERLDVFGGYMEAEFLQLIAPEPWPLPDVEISDFGRQVAEEFLSQFDSLFVPLGWRNHDTGNIHTWIGDEWYIINDMPHFITEGMTVFDHFGNELSDDLPFVDSYGMIANGFELYDLDHDGIPEIVITFVTETWGFSHLYRFVDGQYARVSTNPDIWIGIHLFYYDHNGNIGFMQSDDGPFGQVFYHLAFDGYVMNLTYALTPHWQFCRSLQGLTRIPSLVDLEAEITESIHARLWGE